MNTICLFCGTNITIEDNELGINCPNCNFINKINKTNSISDSNIHNIRLSLKNNLTQTCFPPFDNTDLNNVGEKQKNAILRFIKRQRLDRKDADLLRFLSNQKEWIRVNKKKEKSISQAKIYEFFNKIYRNASLNFSEFNKGIKKIHTSVIGLINNYHLEAISKDFALKNANVLKSEYLALIRKNPFILENTKENKEKIELLKLNADKSELWRISYPIFELVNLFELVNDKMGKISSYQEAIEEKLFHFIKELA